MVYTSMSPRNNITDNKLQAKILAWELRKGDLSSKILDKKNISRKVVLNAKSQFKPCELYNGSYFGGIKNKKRENNRGITKSIIQSFTNSEPKFRKMQLRPREREEKYSFQFQNLNIETQVKNKNYKSENVFLNLNSKCFLNNFNKNKLFESSEILNSELSDDVFEWDKNDFDICKEAPPKKMNSSSGSESSRLFQESQVNKSHPKHEFFHEDSMLSEFLIENMNAVSARCKERRARCNKTDCRRVASFSTNTFLKKPFQLKIRPHSYSYSESIMKKINESDEQNERTLPQGELNYLPIYLQNKNGVAENFDDFTYRETSSAASSILLKNKEIFDQDLCSEGDSSSFRSSSVTDSENQHSRAQLGKLTVIRRCSAPAVLSAEKFLTKKFQTANAGESNNRRRNNSVNEQTENVRYKFNDSCNDEENQFKDLQEKFQSLLFDEYASENFSLKRPITTIHKNSANKYNTDEIAETNVPNSKNNPYLLKNFFKNKESNNETNHQPKTRKLSLPDMTYISGSERNVDDEPISMNYTSKAKKKSFNDFLLFKRKSADDTHFIKRKSIDNSHFIKRKSTDDSQFSKTNNILKRCTLDFKTPVDEKIERKTSLTESFKAAIRRNSLQEERRFSHDENNNDKKSRRDSLKKNKKERKPSNGSTCVANAMNKNLPTVTIDCTENVPSRKHANIKPTRHHLSLEFNQSTIFDSTYAKKKQNDSLYGFATPAFETWSSIKVKKNQDSLPLLHVAASEGNIELLNTLNNIGVDINELDDSGWPALHYAVCSGNFRAAQILIDYGASIKDYSMKVTNSYCASIRNCIQTA